MPERLEKHPEEPTRNSQSEKILKTADPRSHSVVLDALRGIALLGIVWAHAYQVWNNSTQNLPSLPLLGIDLFKFYAGIWGPFCLILFFLLSGYLLTWTEGMRASRGNYSLRAYVLRRALRLIPTYYVALAFIFLLRLTGLLAGGTPTLPHTLVYLGFFQSFWPVPQPLMGFDAAYWYLTSEVVFYAMLPILVLKIRGLYGRLALFGALVAGSAVMQVLTHITFDAGLGYLPYYLMAFPLTHLWVFVAGALLRMFVERLEEKRPGGSWSTLTFSLFVGSLAYLALLPYIPFLGKALASVEVTRTGLDQILGYREVVLFFAAVPFFVAAVLGSPVLSRILSWRLLGLVGVISYSFYLFHDSFLLLAGRYILRSSFLRVRLRHIDGVELWLAYAGYLGVMVVVIGVIAYLSYRYIESPFLRRRPK